uniref:Uncharacterized protein n=1 Tax=Panagrolaimus davidi TaxID=227884 RepID=A0A914NXY6_9BILA
MYFKNDELILGQTHPSETRLKIVEDSDLHKCLYAGFYKNAGNGEIYCMAFEESGTGIQQTCSIYSIQINEEKALAKFTKVFTFPRFLLPSDPRYSTFVMDSRMLIWSHQNQTFTYIFGTVSLSEASYISVSNFHSLRFKEYQKLSESEEFEYGNRAGIFKESESFGFTQNQIKELLGLPKSFEFSMN